ncbi:MAG: hypothetical protein KF878_03930 [Planctomycetes bacterium]|nr:hypothetical protein [Planctomycetota bacterium]
MFRPSVGSARGLKGMAGRDGRAGGAQPAIAAALCLAFGAAQASAADGQWTGSNQAWNNNGRWTSTNFPNSQDDRAFFANTAAAGDCTSLGTNITLGSLRSGTANSAVADFTGTLTIDSTRTMTITSAGAHDGSLRWAAGGLVIDGALSIRGNFTFTGGTLGGTGTITYVNNNTATIQSSATIPGTLIVNKTGGSLSLAAGQDLVVTNLTIQAGNLVVPAGRKLTILGNFSMSGGTLDASAAGASVEFQGGAWSRTAGTLSGPVTFIGGANQTINSSLATDFNALTIDKSGGNVSLLATTTVGGNLHVVGGTLVVNGQTLTVNGSTEVDGTLNASAASSAVVLNGDFLAASTGTVTMNTRPLTVAGATANFNGLTNFTWTTGTLTLSGSSTPQTFTPKTGQNLGALVINKGAGTNQVDLAGTTTATSLTVNQGVLALGANQLTTTAATTIDSGATVTVGAGGVLQPQNLTVNGLLNASVGAGTVDVTNSVLTGTGTITMGAGRLEVFNDADFSNQAALTFTAGGLLVFDGTSPLVAQDLAVNGNAVLANVQVTGNTTSGVLVSTPITIGGSLTVINGGRVQLSLGNALSVGGAVTLGDATTAGTLMLGTGGATLSGTLSAGAGGGTFNQNGAAVSLAADLNLVGITYTNPGALTFNGGAAVTQTVTISGAAPTPFGAVTLQRTAKTDIVRITSAGPSERFQPTDVTITTGTLDLRVHSRLTGGSAGLSVAADGRIQNSVVTGKTHEFLSAGATNSVAIASGGEFAFSGSGTQLVFKEGRTVRVQGTATFSADGGVGTITLTDEADDAATWTLEVDASVAFTVNAASVVDSLGAGTAVPLLATSSTLDATTTATNTWLLGRIWLGGTSGAWSLGANWSGGSVPSATEAAVFNAASNAATNQPSTGVNAISPIGGLFVFPTYAQTITLDGDLALGGNLSFTPGAGGQILLGGNVLSVGGAGVTITGAFGGGAPGARLRLTRTGAVQVAVGAATTIDAALEVGAGDSGTLVTLSTANALDVDGLVVAHGGTTGSSLTTGGAAVVINGNAIFQNTAGFVASTSQVSVSGDWTAGSGVSFSGAGALTFTKGAAPAQAVTVSGGTYRSVTIGAAGITQQAGSGLWTVPGTLTLTNAGTLTLGGGGLSVATAVTIDTSAGTGIDLAGAPATFGNGLTVNTGKSVRVNGGALVVQGAALTGAGSVDASGAGTVNVAAGLTVDGYTPGATLTFSGTGNWGTATDRNYGPVVIAPGGGNTVSIQGTVSANSVSVQSGTLSVNGNRLELEGASATPLVITGGAVTTTGTIVFQTTAADTQVNALTYGALQLLGTVTHRPQGAITVGGAFTLGTGATFNTSGPNGGDADRNLTVTGAATVQGAIVQNGAILSFANDLNFAGGSIAATGGEVRFTAGGTLTLGGPASTFPAVQVTGGTRTVTSGAAATLSVGGALTLNGGSLTLGANNPLSVTGAVSIDNDATLTLGGSGGSLGGGVSFGSNGTTRALTLAGAVGLAGNVNLTNATAFAQSGTVTFQGGAQTLTLTGAANTFGGAVVVNKTAAADVLTVTGATWTVTGTVTVTQGVVALGGGSSFGGAVSIAANGRLRNTGANGATHVFGASVTITGGQFVFTATNLTLTFKEGETVSATGAGAVVTLEGAAGNPNTLQDEATNGTRWTLAVDAGVTFSAQFLIIRDSHANPGQTAQNSQDAGGNLGWTFPAKTTAWRSAIPGVWSLFTNWSNGVPNSGDTVIFDGVGVPNGNGNSTVDIAGLTLGSLTINGYTGTLSLATQDLAVAGGGTTTITTGAMNLGGRRLTTGSLTINGGALTAGAGQSGIAVDVTSTTGALTLSSGTYTEGAGHTRVAGNVVASGGTWTNNTTGRLVFAGTGTAGTPQTWQGSVNVGEVQVDRPAGLATYVQLASDVTTLGVEVTDAETLDVAAFMLTVTTGTLSVSGTGADVGRLVANNPGGAPGVTTVRTQHLTLTGTGRYDEGAGDTRVSGNLTVAGTASWLDAAGVLVFDGAGGVGTEQQWSGSGAGADGVGAVRVQGGVATRVQLTGGATVRSLNVVTANTFLDNAQTLTILGDGTTTPLIVGGTFTGTGTTVFASATAVTIPTTNTTYGGVTITGGAAYTFAGAATLSGALTVNAAAASVTLGGLTVAGGGVVVSAGALDLNGFLLRTGGGLTVAGNSFTANTAGTPSVEFTGTGNWSGSGVTTFGDVDVVASAAVTLQSAVTCDSLDVTVGTAGIALNNHKLTTRGGLTVVGSNFTPGATGSVDFAGTGGTWSGANVATFGDVDVTGNAAVTLGSAVTARSLDVTANTASLGLVSHKLTTSGGLTVVGAGFTPGTGSVDFSGTGTWTGASVATFGPVTLVTGAGTVTLGSSVAVASLQVNAGAVNLGGLPQKTLTLNGNLVVAGGVNGVVPNSGAIVFAASASWSGANVTSFGPVTVNAGTTTLGSNVAAAGMTVADGATVALSSRTLASSGAVALNGVLNGATAGSTLSVAGNLVVGATGTITNAATLSTTFTAAGTWTDNSAGQNFGAVTVSGGARTATTALTMGTLTVNGAGASLTLAGQTNTGAVTVGAAGANTGTLNTGAAGQLATTGAVTVNAGGHLRTGAGITGVALSVNGNLTVSGALTEDGAGNLRVQGNLNATGATWSDNATPGAGVVVFVGAARTWTGDVFVGDVAIETGGSVTTASSVNCEALDLQGTGSLTVGNTFVLTVQGDLNGATGTLTFNTGASLTLAGAANQAITLGANVNSFRAVSVTKTGGTATVSGAQTWALSATLSLSGSGTLEIAASSNITGVTTVGANTTLRLPALPASRTHTFQTTLEVAGTFEASGAGHTVVFRQGNTPPFGVDVVSGGRFIVNGGTPAIKLQDTNTGQSGNSNQRWHIRVDKSVVTGGNFLVSGAEIVQSEASEQGAGATVLPLSAANSLLSDCVNWSVTSKTTTWNGNNQTWDAGTWTNGAPVNGDEVIFDGTSVGNSIYNGNPANTSLTLLHLRLQAGYTGTLTLLRDLTVLSQLELNSGTLNLDTGVKLFARGPSLAFDGNNQSFNVGAGAQLVFDGSGTIDVTDAANGLSACLPPVVIGDAGGNATTFRLQSSLCVQSLTLLNGTVDLNGHILHVKGDLNVTAGAWISGAGELRFDGIEQNWSGPVNVGRVRVLSSVKPSSDIFCSELTVATGGVVALNEPNRQFTLTATQSIVVTGNTARLVGGSGADAGTTGLSVRTGGLTIQSGGRYEEGSGETRVAGALLLQGAASQWVDAAGVLVFDGGAVQTWTDNTAGQSFGQIRVQGASTVVNATTGLTMGAVAVRDGAVLNLGGASTLGAVTIGTVGPLSTGTLQLPAAGSVTVTTGAMTIIHGAVNVQSAHTLNVGALNVGDPAETVGTTGTLNGGNGRVNAPSVEVNGTGVLVLGAGIGAPAVALNVGGGLTVDAGGVLTEGAGRLVVRGNIAVAGTWNDAATEGQGLLVLEGGVVQTIASTANLGDILLTTAGTIARPTSPLIAEAITVEVDTQLDLLTNDQPLTLSRDLVINGTTAVVRAGAGAVQVRDLTVTAGAYEEGAGDTTVNRNLAITGAGWVDHATGTLVFAGGAAQSWSGAGVTAGQGFGAVRVQGANTQVTGTSDLRMGALTLNAGGTGRLRLQGAGTTTVLGTVTMTLGDLDLATNTSIVGAVSIATGSPVPTLGNSSANGRTHTFGAGIAVNGELIFTANALTLVFAEGQTVAVGATGTFTVQGAVGNRSELRDQNLGGGAPAGQWVLDLTAGGTITVDFANLRDSLTTGAGVPRTATNSSDLGNNTGWAFAAKTTQWTGAAPGGNTAWSADGNWTNDAPQNGDTVEFPSAVGLTSTMDLVGLQLRRLTVNGYTGGTITLMGALNVDHSTSTDPVNDGVFVSAGTLALNGNTLTVSRRVAVSGPANAGVLALGTGTLVASGDVLVTDTGQVTAANGGGVVFQGTTQAWSGTATSSFGRVTLTNGTTVTLGAGVRATNATGQTALQVADGSTLALAGNEALVEGDLLLGLAGSAGTLDATHGGNNSRLRVTGDYTMANAGTTITAPAALLTTFASGGTQSFVPLALDVGRVAVIGTTQVNLGTALTCQALDITNAGSRLNTQGLQLTVTGLNGISGAGTLDATGSIVATGGNMTVAAFVAGASLTFNGAGGTWSGASNFGVVAVDANVALGSAVQASSVTIAATRTLTTGANTLRTTALISGAGALNAATGGVLTGGGLTVTTFTPGNLLTFDGNGAWSGASSFGATRVRNAARVTLGSDVVVSSLIVDESAELAFLGQQVQVNGNVTLGSVAPVTAGRLDATDAGAASRLRVTGNYAMLNGSAVTAPGDLTTTFHGGALQSFTPAAAVDVGNIVATGGGTNVRLQTALVARALTVSAGATLDAATLSQNLNLGGAVDLTGGTLLTVAGRTVTFAGAGAQAVNPGSSTFPADIVVAGGAQVTVGTNPLTATGAVTISAGATLSLQAAGNSLLDVTSPGALSVGAATTVRSIDFTGGTLTLAAAAPLTVQSTSAMPLTGPAAGFTAGAGSTVILAPQAGAPNQTVRSLGYAGLTLTNAAAPAVAFLTDATQLNVGGALTVTAGTLRVGQNVNAGSIAGAGTLDTQGLQVTIAAGTIANTLTLQGLTGGANLATIELLSASAIPSATFGHLVLNAGGAFSLAGGPALVVHGNLLLQSGASFSGNPQLQFRGSGSAAFAVGVATLNLGGLLVQKSAFTDTVTITGGITSNLRNVNGPVNVAVGTLTLGNNGSFRFLEDTTVGNDPNAAGFQGRLQVLGNGVVLQVGGGGGRTLTLHDIMNVGNGNFANLQLVIGAGDRIHLTASKSQLNLNGAPTSKLQIDSSDQSATPTRARITVDAVTGVNAQINATDVSVRANDASGVVNSVGQPRPIQAVSSVDRGENVNWTFEGGGALLIEAATALSDGGGRLTRVRLVYSRALNFGTIGSVHQQFALRRVASDGTVLASVSGTSANAVQTAAGRSLDIVFGAGLAQTDLQDVQVVYTPPTSSFLQSTDGVPALQTQTLSQGGAVPFVDGAPPALVSSFAQDVDGNGGLDRIVFFFSEPIAFSPGFGTSISAYDPATDTAALGLDTQLTLRIAGENPITIDVTSFGARQSGAGIAQVIQQLVRDQLEQAPPVGHDPLKRPAYRNFAAQFVDGRYVFRAGVPLRFEAATTTYVPDFDASTVEVVTGGVNDASALLRLGAANQGVERPGRGDARAGYSASSGAGTYNLVGAVARLRINGEDFREYTLSSNGLSAVAVELEGLVRNADNQARHPPNNEAYTQFVAIPDTARSRLVLVSGTFGQGASVVVNSDLTETFSTTAQIGTNQFAAGAREAVGAANTLISIDDLSIRSQTGANLLLGRTVADVVRNGSTISIELANQPGSGTGSPTFLWVDDGDLAFIADRAPVPNRSTQRATNTPGSSNVVVVGDQNGDLRLGASPDPTISPGADHRVDASPTVPYAGTAGLTVDYQWAFDTGPATPTNIRANGAVLLFDAVTAGTYRFRLTITTTDAQGAPVVSRNTDAQGRQIVYIEVVVSEVAPVAIAGPDRLVIGASVQLDGSQSYDPNGGVGTLTFAWQALDSSGFTLAASVFDDPASQTPTFNPGAFGTYTVRLTVSKSANLEAVDTARITLADAANLMPHADAGPDQVVRVMTPVTLDGRQSRDPEGNPLTYEWRAVSGPSAAPLSDPFAAQPTFTPQVPGTYVFELIVRDGATPSMPDRVSVIAIDDSPGQPRRAPAAVARVGGLRRAAFLVAAPDLVATRPRVVLEHGAEREVVIIDLASTPTDDPPANTLTGMTRVDVIVGTDLFASLYVPLQSDDGDPRGLIVAGGAEAPVVAYGVVASAFVLDGSRSRDDGTIDSYVWRQVDGPFRFSTQTGSILPVVPQTAGTYVFELVVTDTIGLSSFPVEVTVPVIPQALPGAGPPDARVTVTSGGAVVHPTTGPGTSAVPLVATVAGANQTVTFDASTSVSRNGGAVTFSWTQVAGPIAVTSGDLTTALSVMPKAPGSYAFVARVTDANGVSAFATAWLIVAAPGKTPPVARLAPMAEVTVPPGGVAGVTLSGSQSTGTAPLQFLWSQRRGFPVFIAPSGSGAAVELTQAGEYEFVLQVSDGDVVSAPATVTMRVLGTAEPALASGASQSKSTGGCALRPAAPHDGGGRAAWLLGLALLVLAARRGRRGS